MKSLIFNYLTNNYFSLFPFEILDGVCFGRGVLYKSYRTAFVGKESSIPDKCLALCTLTMVKWGRFMYYDNNFD